MPRKLSEGDLNIGLPEFKHDFAFLITLLRPIVSIMSFHINPVLQKNINLFLITISLSVAISFLLAPGPLLQNLMIGILNGNSSSIYESANGTEVVPFVSLSDWLLLAASPSLIIISILTAYITMRSESPIKMIIFISATFSVSLTVNDFIHIGWESTQAGLFIESLFANIFGGVLIGAAMIVWSDIIERILSQVDHGILLRGAVTSVSVIALGFVSSMAIFYVADFFLRPLPVRVDMFLSTPTHGGFGTSKEYISPEDPAFSLFPSQFDAPIIEWSAPDGNLSVDWKALDRDTAFDASIVFVSDCMEPSWLTEDKAPGRNFMVSDVKNMHITFENGAEDLWILDKTIRSVDLEIIKPNATVFGIDQGEKTGAANVWQFVNEETELVYATDSTLSFYLGSPSVEKSGNFIQGITKTILIKIDDKSYKIKLKARDLAADAELDCKEIPSDRVFISGNRILSKLELLRV